MDFVYEIFFRRGAFPGSLFGLERSDFRTVVAAAPEHHPWGQVDVIQSASVPPGPLDAFSCNFRILRASCEICKKRQVVNKRIEHFSDTERVVLKLSTLVARGRLGVCTGDLPPISALAAASASLTANSPVSLLANDDS